jgi:signal peptidase I
MFGFAVGEVRRARASAAGCLEVAQKVWHYRSDQLPAHEADGLRRQIDLLRLLLGSRAQSKELAVATEALEKTLREVGGNLYPKSALAENIEFLLLIAIVVIGFRSYFVQNFVIPTNSMWPTYNGMTPQVFRTPADEPGVLSEAGRILAVGAWPHRLNSPAGGEILIPIGGSRSLGYAHCIPVNGRSWLVLPSKEREYTFIVGGEQVRTRVPLDFDFDWAVYDGFFSKGEPYTHKRLAAAIGAKLQSGDYVDLVVDGEPLHCIRTGRLVKAGERLLAFDELAGDKVLVDRFSYNFVRPEVGSGFVFSTGKIPGIARYHGDTFYIKRLVGIPGDTLEVRGTTLFRNGAPIEGSDVFAANSSQTGKYPGYEASGLLAPGSQVHVEPGSYFAMGDNSPNSGDGREWGFVPAKEALGRPIAVYYPLARWSLAH